MKRFAVLLPLVFCAPSVFAADPLAESAVKLGSLSAEHEANPMGIGAALPRLSWKLISGRAGEVQTAYEIRAASTAALLGTAPDLFDTGKVASAESVLVAWPGKALASRQQAYWQVRVWDKEGKASAWSDPGSIELGILPADDAALWKGQWITVDLPRYDIVEEPLAKASWIGAGALANQAVAAATTIELPADAKVYGAIVDANADGLLALYVNGQATKQGPSSHTAPFHADFPQQLKAGKNVIGLYSLAVRNARGPAGRNAMAARVVIELEGGKRIELNTDGDWRAAVPPAAAGVRGGAGTPDRWTFDDSTWTPAAVIGPYNASKPVASADSTVGPGRYLRKVFTVGKPISQARLYSTALGTYEARINGKPINDHQLDPGWTDYAKRVMVQTTDVTPLIAQGPNVVGALLSDGWFAGRLGWQGLGSYTRVSERPLFNAQLVLTYADGTTETIGTDATWKGGGGDMLGSDQQLGEVIDHRQGTDWAVPRFDDSAWKSVALQEVPTELDPQLGPPVRRVVELAPQKITRINGLYLVDLGQNMVGHVRLRARGAAGTTIVLQHAEMLNKDGTIYNENLRQAISLDRFVLKGDAAGETFEPQFTFHGFRYVQIAGYPGDLTADDIRGVVVGSDTPNTGTFESSSADINKLWSNIRWGQRGNYISVPTDCPQRDERMGWMGDALAFAPTAARNTDVAGFFTKFMRDVVDGQRADGQFNNVNPVAGQTQSYPVWADAGVIIPWEMYQAYGDKSFLASNYDAMARWVDYGRQTYPTLLRSGGVGDHLAPTGRGPGAGAGGAGGAGRQGTAPATNPSALNLPVFGPSASGRLYPVAAPAGAAPAQSAPATGNAGGPGRGAGRGFGGGGGAGRGGPGGFGGGGVSLTNIVDTAYFARSAWILSQAAAILGKPEDAARFDKLFHDIVDAFNKAYVNSTDGTFAVPSPQTAYILALQFNLLPEKLRPMAEKYLIDDVAQRQHLTTGFVGVGLINPTLSSIGRSDLAYDLLFQDTYPSWLFTIRQGATTIWERWDGYTPETGFQASSMNSFNHYSLGSVGLWLYSGPGGIQRDPVSPGYKHFELRPQFTTRLTFVKATQETPYGTIASGWRREGNQYVYDATVPANSSAMVTLPGMAAASGDPTAGGAGEGGVAQWMLPAGTYHFTFAADSLPEVPGNK